MRRRIFDREGHACFVSFSCFRRRRLLDDKQAKGIVIHFLSVQLKNQGGNCLGFVIMPDHVHALVHFNEQGQLSIFMNQWKRSSSMGLKRLYRGVLSAYGGGPERPHVAATSTMFLMCFPKLKPGKSSITCTTTR